MVLASQFNSFRQPLIVMISQPLAVIGGTFGIWIVDQILIYFDDRACFTDWACCKKFDPID